MSEVRPIFRVRILCLVKKKKKTSDLQISVEYVKNEKARVNSKYHREQKPSCNIFVNTCNDDVKTDLSTHGF